MGNRANLVIVEDGDWRLYYSHWAGCRILDGLVAGPEHAVRYIRSFRECDKNGWTDPLWADGGAVVDLDRHRLLFFGDELMVGLSERRALLTALDMVWQDYAIGWAYDGTVELANYVGLDLPDSWDLEPLLRLVEDPDGVCHVVSVAGADGRLRLWPLCWPLGKESVTPAMLDLLPGRGVRRLTLGTLPAGGVHIDVSRKTVGAWQTIDAMGLFQALPKAWAGWQVQCWQDHLEEQLTQCRGALRVPALDVVAGIDNTQAWIHARVFGRRWVHPDGRVSRADQMLEQRRDDDLTLYYAVQPRADQWARFAAACDFLRGTPAQSA